MKKLLLFFVCISIFKGFAQNGFTTYTTNLSIFGTNLKQTAFLVDNSGNKWIGFGTVSGIGNAGLVKYNNSNWTLYNTASTPALPSNNITSLVQDSIGNLWIGTDSGLVKFNGSQFIRYTTTNGLPANYITSVDAIGNVVYIGTLHGLSKYDGIGFTNYNTANSQLSSDSIFSIKMQTKTQVWLGGNNRLMRYLYLTSTLSVFYNYPSNNSGVLNCILLDNLGQKWIGTTNAGLLIFNGTTFTDASTLYTIPYSTHIPKAVYDISKGYHNGVLVKLVSHPSSSVSVGFIELSPNNKIHQYLNFNSQTFILGDYFAKHGNKVLISQGGPNLNYLQPKMYYEFDTVFYKNLLIKNDTTNNKYLDINNVKAGVQNKGDLQWNNDIGGVAYEVPKGSGNSTCFKSSLWIGGLDNANQLHGAAQTYRQGGLDFWAGPLDTINGTIDAVTSLNYDRIWKVSYIDINNFITAFNSGSIVATPDMLAWPAHGSGNNSRNLAPFVDYNGDGLYNPNDGDYPKIKGDQALYFIFNDKLSTHQVTGCNPMGVEVQGMAYAYGCPAVVNGRNELTYTTFYNYKIINRSATNYHDVFVSMWSDVDLGYYADDYLGSNVTDNYGYTYNGIGIDSSFFGPQGYGHYIPAQGINIVKGPFANVNDGIDNNNNGRLEKNVN